MKFVTAVYSMMLLASAAAAAPTFALLPSTNLAGMPREVVGWGFTLTNDQNYLVVSNASWAGPDAPFFTDFISMNFAVIGPDGAFAASELTQTFDAAAQRGLGSFSIPSNVSIGDVFSGQIRVFFDVYTVSPDDPAFDPDTHTLRTGDFFQQSVQVSAGAVPEPGSLGLVAAAVGFAFATRNYRPGSRR